MPVCVHSQWVFPENSHCSQPASQSVSAASVFPLKPKRKPGTETKAHYKIPSWLIGVYASEVKSLQPIRCVMDSFPAVCLSVWPLNCCCMCVSEPVYGMYASVCTNVYVYMHACMFVCMRWMHQKRGNGKKSLFSSHTRTKAAVCPRAHEQAWEAM